MEKKVKRPTQCDEILNFLTRYGSISDKDAYFSPDIRSRRLAARIHDLRQRGVSIQTDMVKEKKPNGRIVEYAVYRLVKVGENG